MLVISRHAPRGQDGKAERARPGAVAAAQTGGGAGSAAGGDGEELPQTPGEQGQLAALTASMEWMMDMLSQQQATISTLQASFAARERDTPQEGGGQVSQVQGSLQEGGRDATAQRGVSAGSGGDAQALDGSEGAAESVPVTLAGLRALLGEDRQQSRQQWINPEFSEKFNGDVASLPRWSQEALAYLDMFKGEPVAKAWFLANKIGKESLQSQVKLALVERPRAEQTPQTVLRLLRAAMGVDAHTAALEAAQRWVECHQRARESVADFVVRYKEALLQGQPDLQPALNGRFGSLMFVVRLRPALVGVIAAAKHDVRTLEAAIVAATREGYHMNKRQLQKQRRDLARWMQEQEQCSGASGQPGDGQGAKGAHEQGPTSELGDELDARDAGGEKPGTLTKLTDAHTRSRCR